MRRGVILTRLQNTYFMCASVPNALKQCKPTEWATIESRRDPRIDGDIEGKSTLRTTLHVLGNGIRIIEELEGDKVMDDFIQKIWVGEWNMVAKPDSLIFGTKD